MRVAPALPAEVVRLVRRQEGAATTAQLLAAGLTRRQLRTLVGNGWRYQTRGVMVASEPADAFRASVRAALLACPSAVACGVTAARIHGLWGLPQWVPNERPHLLLAAGRSYNARNGVRLHSGALPEERTVRDRLPVTTIERTVLDMSPVLAFNDLVCLLDSALRLGWQPRLSKRMTQKLRAALALADVRAESAFETLLRLLFVHAGVPPEALQFEVFDVDGRLYARLDMAWPSTKVAVEADGRAHHDAVDALYRDRTRANQLELQGWTILRFTWADLVRRPDWIVDQVRRALNPDRVVNRPA